MTEVKVGIKFRPLMANESENQLKWSVEGDQVKSKNGKHDIVFGKFH